MGLTSALNAAVSGLNNSQAQIDLISQNVSNAGSAGYTRRTLTPLQSVVANRTSGVLSGTIERVYDRLVQRQLRTETAGAAYTGVHTRFTAQLDRLYGTPGSASALDSIFNSFTQSLQTLAAQPSSATARVQSVQAAQLLAGTINGISNDVQALRADAERAIGSAVQRANQALASIEQINSRLTNDVSARQNAALLDERDRAINDLARIADIKVVDQANGGVNIFTTSGFQLFDGVGGTRLQFDVHDALTPQSLYNTNPALRGVGTLSIVTPAGATIDVVAQGVFRSGEIQGLLEMRDKALVEAQVQLDELAAGLARALSDRNPPAAAATAGAAQGFDIDLAGIQAGNSVTIDYFEQPGNVARRATIIRVDDPASLPLPLTATADPNDLVIGVSFAGGVAGAVAAIQAGLTAGGTGLTVANPAGTMLRVLDDGAAATRDIGGVSAGITNTALTGQGVELPFFVDRGLGNAAYTGSFDGSQQQRGFAQRISLNAALAADPSRLIVFSTTPLTPAGDTARPLQLIDRLTQVNRDFSPEAGIGGSGLPHTGTVSGFVRRILDTQGGKAVQAQRIDEGQQVVVNALSERFADVSGVKIDSELADLVQVQNAYAANARVIGTVKDLIDVLLRL